MKLNVLTSLCACVCLALLTAAPARAATSDWSGKRAAALARKRDVMYYLKDEDPVFWPKGQPFSVKAFLGKRLLPLDRVKAGVDTLVYAPLPSFANLSANIPSADHPTHQAVGSSWLAGTTNMLPAFYAAGTDPLREACKWADAGHHEIIVSLCLNDLSNGGPNSNNALPPPWLFDSFLYPPFKMKNPGYLMGGASSPAPKGVQGVNPPRAPWFALDYSREAVRQKFGDIAKDIADNYPVDGICLDFMSGPWIFKSVAWGLDVSAKDSDGLTTLLRRIRTAAEIAGKRRGRPILISVMVPDSLPFCKGIGINLDAWMSQKLVDFVIAGGDFQLNPWSYMAGVCQKAGVPFYANLSISGIWVGNDNGGTVDDERIPRQCYETYRARATDALTAKAAGVLFSDVYWWWRINPDWMCGRLNDLRLKDKRYFVTYRAPGGEGALKDGGKFRTLPVLVSGNPEPVKSAGVKHDICLWDDFEALKRQGVFPSLVLTTEAVIPTGMDISVLANGQDLKLIKKRAGCQLFTLPLAAARFGKNEIIVRSKGRNKRGSGVLLGNIAVDVTFPQAKEVKP